MKFHTHIFAAAQLFEITMEFTFLNFTHRSLRINQVEICSLSQCFVFFPFACHSKPPEQSKSFHPVFFFHFKTRKNKHSSVQNFFLCRLLFYVNFRLHGGRAHKLNMLNGKIKLSPVKNAQLLQKLSFDNELLGTAKNNRCELTSNNNGETKISKIL